MEPVRGALAGLGFTFACDAADLAAYARRHLAPLASTPMPEAVVHATLRWHDGQPPGERSIPAGEIGRLERIDRDLYVGSGQLRWFRVDDLRDLHLQVRLEQEQVVVHGDFYYRLGNTRWTDRLRRIRQWRRRDAFRRRRFTTLLAYLVYYPCWWWWEQCRDYHPIHAAGVQTDAGVVLLAGAGGVGKSTLSTALALSPGARLLSDSFVLHHSLDVKAVREPVLLDAFSRGWLGSAAEELQPLQWRYGFERAGYHLPESRRAEEGRATLLVFPRRSPQSYARRISAEEAHRRLSAADFIINDLRRYWAFAAVMDQMEPAGLMARREAQLARLTGGVACYDLGLTAETSRAEVVQTILQLLPGAPRRVMNARGVS